MREMNFTFTEEDMIIALKANGWSTGWIDTDWIDPCLNPDYAGVNLKTAFENLLYNKNLISNKTDKYWK